MVKSSFECYKNYMSHTFQKQTSPICSYLWNFLIIFLSKSSYMWKSVKVGNCAKKSENPFFGQKSRFRVRFQKIGFLWILDKNLWFFFPVKAETLNFNVKLFTYQLVPYPVVYGALNAKFFFGNFKFLPSSEKITRSRPLWVKIKNGLQIRKEHILFDL